MEIVRNLASRRGNSPREWENLLFLAAAEINSTRNKSTGYRPDLLQMGRIINREVQRLAPDLQEDHQPESLDDRMKRLQEVQDQIKKIVHANQEKNHQNMLKQYRQVYEELKIGDIVLHADLRDIS